MIASACASSCKKDSPAPANAPPAPLRVAAAADLASAFKDVGDEYKAKTGQEVKFSFGSTGLLAKQIAEGAPYDVFAAANVSYADDTTKAGACFADTKSLYATGRIVMWAMKTASLPAKIEDLADPKFAKIAIANPEHAPYGQAAKQALTKAGIWDKVSPRIVYGENVQQTLEFAQSGNAEVAIVALSLAIVSEGQYVVIDSALHDRIDQALVVCKGSGAAASQSGKAFTAFVGSPDGRAIMRRYGFLLPGETPVAADHGGPSRNE
ncbi:MAG: molybdate ABC transporter substrate-binding protein [Polyangiaceae bacterium]